MTTHVLADTRPTRVAPHASSVAAPSASAAPARPVAMPIDLAGAQAHFEDPLLGIVPLWFLDAKPRRGAAIMLASHDAWCGKGLAEGPSVRAGQLQARGIAVLIVDTRPGRGTLWRWLACAARVDPRAWRPVADAAFTRAAARYLEDRGFDAEDIERDRMG